MSPMLNGNIVFLVFFCETFRCVGTLMVLVVKWQLLRPGNLRFCSTAILPTTNFAEIIILCNFWLGVIKAKLI